MHILFLLQTAFSIWMVVDAIKRGSPFYWYIIIMFPFGEWVYFFTVKINDPAFKRFFGGFLTRPPNLQQLRYEASTTPSVLNRIWLAQALHDSGEHGEASELFEEILEQTPDDKVALLGLAQCCVGQGDSKRAIATLEKLIEIDFAADSYSVAVQLAGLLWRGGRREDSVALLRRVVKKNPAMSHMIDLARCLSETDRREEARGLLQQALDDFENSPKFVKRNDRAYVKTARTLLKQLET